MALAGLAARQLAPAAAAAATGCRRLPALCRAVGSKAVKPPEPETAYCFERAPDEPLAFPELLQPGRRVVLLAVDPDLGGAVAALSWRNPPAAAASEIDAHSHGSSSYNESSRSNESSSSSSSEASLPLPSPQQGLPSLPLLEAVHIELHDMPIEVWKYGSRDKRQPEAAGLIRILQRYLGAPGAGFVGDGGIGSIASGESSSGKKKRSGKAAGSASKRAVIAPAIVEAVPREQPAARPVGADQQQQQQEGVEKEEPALVRAVVEYSLPPAVSGKFAWYGIGFAVGLLNGLLVGQGITYRRVPSSTWKQQMGLKKQGKEGSIALARHLLPTAAGMLNRKKDHGRAEALLMAAWGLGVRMHPIAPISSSIEDAATDTDGEAAAGEDEDEGDEGTEEEP